MVTNENRLIGLDAISEVFERTGNEGRSAFMPYFTLGYPDYETSLEIIETMAKEGADGFEIGIPFSDPLADGPTIQYSSQVALEGGMNVRKALEGMQELRARGVTQPMIVFSYLNPLINYGTEQFVRDAGAAGADGLIIPDLPPEEAHLFAPTCEEENMALIFFLAPTSDEKRIEVVAEAAKGFIYVVSVTGVTGSRTELPTDLKDFIASVRAKTDKPLVLGFGISTPEHVKTLHGLVDGFIVGSALVRAAKEGVGAVRELAENLRQA
jgi:tryptophan synthase alpha chain